MYNRSRKRRKTRRQGGSGQRETESETPMKDTAANLPECQPACDQSSSGVSLQLATGKSPPSRRARQTSSCSRISHERSPSPARLARQKEHSELQRLNGRLSSHADNVKQLQAENARLKLQLETMDDVIKRETTTIKQLHGFEIKTLQDLLDKCLDEKSQLESRCEMLTAENENLSLSLRMKIADIADIQEKLEDLKSTSVAYNQLLSDLEATQTALKENMEDVKRLSAELVKEKRLNRRLEEEAKFNKERYLKEVEEASARFSEHMHQADQKLEEGYETLVSDALSSVREQHMRDLEGLRNELTATYQTKLTEWKSKCEVAQADLLALKREIKITKQEHDKLRDNVTQLKADKAALEVQWKESQNRIEELKDVNERERCQAQREVALLTQELTEVKEELEEVGGANSRLEAEINAYRLIVEELEDQTPTKDTNKGTDKAKHAEVKAAQEDDGIFQDEKSTPIKETKKRKKKEIGEAKQSGCKGVLSNVLNTTSKQDFFRTNEFSQGIDILDIDSDGKYITLINTTDHPVDLCLWSVQQSDSTGQWVKYEINASTQLARGKCLTIWSCDMGHGEDSDAHDHDRGDDPFKRADLMDSDGEFRSGLHLTMSTQSWMKLDQQLQVRVEDGDGQLQAKCEIINFKEKTETKRLRLFPLRHNCPLKGEEGLMCSNSASRVSQDSAKLEYGGVCASSSFAAGAAASCTSDEWRDPRAFHDKDNCMLM